MVQQNAILKVTKIELELLTDYTIFLLYEAGIRGVYCAASTRHVKANKPNLSGYNSSNPANFQIYFYYWNFHKLLHTSTNHNVQGIGPDWTSDFEKISI